MNTDEIRALVATLENDTNLTGDALIAAEHNHKLTVRRALLSGDHDSAEVTRLAVDSARIAHQNASARIIEARILLQESIDKDRAIELEVASAEVRNIAAQIEALGPLADAALATYLGKVAQMRRLEILARHIVEKRMNRTFYTGAVASGAFDDAKTYLSTVRADNAKELGPITADRANLVAKRIRDGAGIQS